MYRTRGNGKFRRKVYLKVLKNHWNGRLVTSLVHFMSVFEQLTSTVSKV